MATKEDILEQIVEEFLVHRGYFVQHNIKFRPCSDRPDFVKNKDSNHSDIDVLAYHPRLNGPEKVLAVSCKSWQSGFDVGAELRAIQGDKKIRGRQAWQGFRELCVPKWAEAFAQSIYSSTGENTFTHVLAVTALRGDREAWEQYEPFRELLGGNEVRIITFAEMVSEIERELTTTVAATEVGRLLQLFKAAGLR